MKDSMTNTRIIALKEALLYTVAHKARTIEAASKIEVLFFLLTRYASVKGAIKYIIKTYRARIIINNHFSLNREA